MSTGLGIALAFVTMISWGIGDFLIQRSTRRVGDFETLFIISFFGLVVLSPFVRHSLPDLLSNGWSMPLGIVISASAVLFLAALFQFESLREGKIAVVEPSWSIEIPTAALLAFFILGEEITGRQILLMVILMVSLILVGLRTKKLSWSLLLEKGLLLAIVAGIASGSANFFAGWGGRVSDPILMNFFYNAFIVIASGLFLLYKSRGHKTLSDIKSSWRLLLSMSIFDTLAWITFIVSMSLLPIAIATALSESYIIIAVLLGLFIGKEKLQLHQKWGLVGAIVSAVTLAAITGM
jgi:drug/metabolite transporter (DMT)-like permease